MISCNRLRHCVQVAIHELSKALPEDQRPLPLDKVEVNDNATFWLPNTGGTAGSTAAEGSCEAVRMACEQLVGLLPVAHRPACVVLSKFVKCRHDFIIDALAPALVQASPCSVLLP